MGGTHIVVTPLQRNACFLKNAGPPMQNLKVFREVAELNLMVYLSMEAETVIGVLNSYDLAWSVLKSNHFR